MTAEDRWRFRQRSTKQRPINQRPLPIEWVLVTSFLTFELRDVSHRRPKSNPRKLAKDLVGLDRVVLFFLRLFADVVQPRCDGSVRLSVALFERLAPAKRDHHPDDHDFNHYSHNVLGCQKGPGESNRNR